MTKLTSNLSDVSEIGEAMRFDIDNCYSVSRKLLQYQSNGRELYLLVENTITRITTIITIIYKFEEGRVNKNSYLDDKFMQVSPSRQGTLTCCLPILALCNNEDVSAIAYRLACRRNVDKVERYRSLIEKDLVLINDTIFELVYKLHHGWICLNRKNNEEKYMPFIAILNTVTL